MRLKTCALCSTSLALVLFSATPAFGQTEPAAPAGSAQAQESPNDPPQGPAPAADEESIVVTGLRRSLQSSQNIKRNSEQIVDAIVAEDIGKLPDITVSDTAARIPGIQVERRGGEASNVLLRGLDEEFYTTTYNGREIFTAETRSVALQDFPAGAIAAVEAFKTSTANLVEPGLAGLINVRSRRPFDFQGLEIAGSLWGNYPEESKDFEPNFNLLVSNRWQAGDGEIGALINISYTRMHFQDSIRRHGFFIAGLAGARSPDWPEIQYAESERWRPSVNGALQWRPSPGLEFYVEGLWQGYRENQMDRMFAQPLWGGGDRYTDIVLDGDRIVSGRVDRPGGPFEAWGFQGATKRRTNTYQFAAGGSYDTGALRVSADIARSDTQFDLRTESVDYEINNNNYAVEWFTGRRGDDGPTFQLIGFDPTNVANYNYRGFYEDHLTAKGDDWQARLDFEYEPAGITFLRKIEWGVRYVSRDASAERGDFYWNLTARGGGPGNYCCGSMLGTNAPVPITAVPLDYRLFSPGFSGDDNAPFPRNWLAPTFGSVWNNLEALRQFNIGLTGAGSVDGPAVNPARTFNINEKAYAAYAQLNYAFTLGTTEVNGVIGLRAVRTKEDILGTRAVAGGLEPIDFQNSYTDWLPNVNANIRFSPDWQLRLAATETRTRPTFQQLNPALVLNAPPGCSPGASDCVRRGTGGNPFLRPLQSRNYDASLEYYFSRTGFASAAIFRRDMRGFIANSAVQFPDPDENGLPIIVTGPVNTNKGRIQGVELQFSSFFDFDGVPSWLRAFGLQANATYIDAKADYSIFPEDHAAHIVRRLRIPDVSKWTYNVIGMYENAGLTARLAYNLRTGYPEGALAERDVHLPNPFTLQGHGRRRGRLDWSSSYAINDNLTVFLDWLNILKNPFKSDIVRVNYNASGVAGSEAFPMVYRLDERIVSGGVRFRF